MRLTLPGLFLAAAIVFAQPTQSDRYRLAPLVAAARLWNMIRYVDPRVAGASTDWDAALIAALPKLESAHSDEDLATALDGMLATLHDPCTRISLGMPGSGVTVESLDSGTMVIHAGNGDLSGSMGAGLMLKMGIPQTSNIVWDLRGARLPFTRRLTLEDLRRAGFGYGFRQISGYPEPESAGQRYYTSSFQVVPPGPPIKNNGPAPPRRRQIFLIDKNSAVPLQAIIDQAQGRSAILSEDPPQAIQAGVTELVQVLGKVEAEVRVAEIYYPDGTTAFAPNRVILNRGAEAVKAAAGAVDEPGWPMPGQRPHFEILPAGFRDVAGTKFPDRAGRILAAFRIWGILHYFDPRVSAMGSKWDDVLVELLPKFSEAASPHDYHLAIAEMAARTGDPSCRAESPDLDAFFGKGLPPFEARLLGNELVVTKVFTAGKIEAGDVITKIAGVTVAQRMAKISPYLPSADLVQRFLMAGPPRHEMSLTVRGKDGIEHEVPVMLDDGKIVVREHRTGDAVRMIGDKIGYADLERIEASAVDRIFEKLAQASGIIFDLRGFPRDTALAIASRLGDRNQPVAALFVRNQVGVGLTESHITGLQWDFHVPASLKSRYRGKTVALIDEISSELAAESAMCLKAANGTVLIGSPVVPRFSVFGTGFDLPGGAKAFFGGQTPRWPDGTALKDDRIEPDVPAAPTPAGLRAGKDEVLDAAVAYLSK